MIIKDQSIAVRLFNVFNVYLTSLKDQVW